MLLREQVESSKIKLERAEKKTAEFTKLQTENEVRFIKSRKIITCYIMVFEEIPKYIQAIFCISIFDEPLCELNTKEI